MFPSINPDDAKAALLQRPSSIPADIDRQTVSSSPVSWRHEHRPMDLVHYVVRQENGLEGVNSRVCTNQGAHQLTCISASTRCPRTVTPTANDHWQLGRTNNRLIVLLCEGLFTDCHYQSLEARRPCPHIGLGKSHEGNIEVLYLSNISSGLMYRLQCLPIRSNC